MAPWPDRLDSHHPPGGFAPPLPPHPAGPAPATPPAGPTPIRSRSSAAAARYAAQTSRMSQFEVLNGSDLHVSSSSEDEELQPPRPSRPRHGRSLSHPFPLLFSNKKKKPVRPPSEDSDSNSTDELAQMTNSKTKPQQPQTHRNGHNTGSRDFATGHCMTCGSLVRWPRELHVFRCTICLTINDLQPVLQDERRENTSRDKSMVDDGSALPKKPPRNTDPISLEHTRTLITQCLQEYLQRVLAAPATRQSTWDPELRTKSFSPDCMSNGSASPDAPVLSNSPQGPTQIPTRSAKRNSDLKPTNAFRHTGSGQRSYSTSYPDKRSTLRDVQSEKSASNANNGEFVTQQETKRLFKRLDDYVVSTVTSFQALNTSFVVDRSSLHLQPLTEPIQRRTSEARREPVNGEYPFTDLDAKMLMVGDFAENGSWWTGGQEDHLPTRTASHISTHGPSYVSQRTPRLDWEELDDWYHMVLNPAKLWPAVYDALVQHDPSLAVTDSQLRELGLTILRAQDHTQRNLLKATESILKRPGRPIARPSDLRFLLIILANPLLQASYKSPAEKDSHFSSVPERGPENVSASSGPASGQHSGITKRVLGLLSNAPNDCHSHVISWFARYPESRFAEIKALVGRFLVYRLLRQHEKKQEVKVDVVGGLIPSMSAGRTPASLHAALGTNARQSKKSKEPPKKQLYTDDWQIRAAAQVMALVFAANNTNHSRRKTLANPSSAHNGSNGVTSRDAVHTRGQVFPTSDFYLTLLDDSDLVADFEAWEHKRGKFSFCQYPFLLSIGAKIQILEYDARRQMQSKARDAFFDSLVSRRAIEQYLTLDVRRDCLVEDSLSAVSEVIGSGSEDVKKGLRIIFRGEEGIDAGGLRKEWFLLLIREVFNPEHADINQGMFVYDEDSQHCYFNPNSFETSDQYFLVGVVFGLAIYNSTILDVAFPPFAFRKLLMAAPATAAASPAQQPRPAMTYTLEDLAQYRPRLARGFRQLLDYEEDDVESVFLLDFVAVVEKYGVVEQMPLCAGGERRPVTKANRREYVDLYVRYLLDTAVTRQFEPFKRGFFTVCGGNALSLFRPEEIELLVRGSDEALDIASLKAVAVYENWGGTDTANSEPTVRWFWDTFAAASPQDQRKLLLFITGSDRIPAMGAASLQIRIACHGEDTGRYPTARTCFNSLLLYRYRDRARLERLLWTAVRESEGFGLK
ncbi:HECT-domain-containing protein [Coniochaeta ligniaria NRRL 30616]|uniref:HECT-type E3 ubiquitin transferase n=1 Tax=Coniochaeta ligniaria NRRL 30616 TaxID=1408157 RepID=A0A1J7IDV0_9PEZI|nr:HECT-domain-containing protein [Coniochaeta ligniaria NRRL 30616]